MATVMENEQIREAEEKQETREGSRRSEKRDLEDSVTPGFLMLKEINSGDLEVQGSELRSRGIVV